MYCKLHVLGRVLAITHPGRCIAHLGTCIVLWGGCVSEITLQMLGGIDSVRINTPPPWKKEWLLGVWEREWKQKWIIPFPKFGKGREWEKNIFTNREREGNGKIYSQNSGTGREWKKSVPTFRERELEAIIPGNRDGNGKKSNKVWQYKRTFRKYVAWEGAWPRTGCLAQAWGYLWSLVWKIRNRDAQNAKRVGLYTCSSRLDLTEASTPLRIWPIVL